jgi:hypothetical protein
MASFLKNVRGTIKKPGAEATGLKMKFSFRNRNLRVVIWYYGITEKSGH